MLQHQRPQRLPWVDAAQANGNGPGLQVRDVEASLQDVLLDGFHDLVAARAAAAGATGKEGNATVAALEAASALRVILGRLPGGGVATSASVARACAALKAKGRLKCKPMAAGLQAIIDGRGERRQHWPPSSLQCQPRGLRHACTALG